MSSVARKLQRASSLVSATLAKTVYSLWPANPTPSILSVNDSDSVELGLKFVSSITADVAGVRFYKGPYNVGLHTGSLWTNDQNLLASATFSNETATGWQSVYFDSPVTINAETTYVVSYHAPSGYYSANGGYFATSGVTTGALSALSNTVSVNGLYKYSTSTVFPSESFNATNYWVDVIVVGPADTTPPTQPTNISANISGKLVELNWTASTDAFGVMSYKVYRDGTLLGSTDAVTYTDRTAQPETTYTYTIRAVDYAGNHSQESSGYTLTTEPGLAPTATFTATLTGLLVYVNADSSSDVDGSIVSYAWDFGDGTTGNGKYADHSYDINGTYTITLNVTDDDGISTSIPHTITVSSEDFIANLVYNPSLGGYPDETNTGVPSGTILTSFTGAYYVENDNEVVDSMDITGMIVIQANNVTIRNTRITSYDYYPIRRDEGSGLLVEDTEIIGLTPQVTCAIGFGDFTARRLNVHGTADGFKANGAALIEDCFVHDLAIGEGTHNDGLQSTGGGSGVILRHNTFRLGSPLGVNACIQFGNEGGPNNDWLVENNIFDGGGWIINASNNPAMNTNIRFVSNRFTHRYAYGIGSTGNPVWVGNYYDDTGAIA